MKLNFLCFGVGGCATWFWTFGELIFCLCFFLDAG